MNNTALIIIDVQNDFCSGGILAAKDTDSLIVPLNKYIQEAEQKDISIIYSKDWHPVDHKSFSTNGGIWQPHCVANTKGAELHPLLYLPSISMLVNKGIKKDVEGYSIFDNTGLSQKLHKSSIKNVIICGIAIEYCVYKSAIDSNVLGFKTFVIKNLTRGIELINGDISRTFEHLKQKGVIII